MSRKLAVHMQKRGVFLILAFLLTSSKPATAQEHAPVTVTRLYTGADGVSHFEQMEVKFSEPVSAKKSFFVRAAPGLVQGWHNAPAPRYVVTLSGRAELEVTGGQKFVAQAGQIFLAEDLTGKGHTFRVLGDNEWVAFFVDLEPLKGSQDACVNATQPSAEPHSTKASHGAAEVEIEQVEAQLTDAILRSDVESLRLIYADDYLQTGTNGKVTNKEQRLAEFRNGLRKITVLRRDEVNIRASGDTAIVTDLDTAKGTVAGAQFDSKARAIRVYEKRNGVWQLIAAQSTSIQ